MSTSSGSTHTNPTPRACASLKDDLVLYHYDELGASARADLDVHLEGCAGCRAELASLQILEGAIPRSPSVQIDDDRLAAIRSATSRYLASLEPRPRLRLVVPSWPQVAVAASVAVLMFFTGRITAPGGQSSIFGVTELPSLADTRVSDIEFDPERGVVRIAWEESRPVTIEADVNDARVRSLLSRAMQDEDNPGGRLRAVRAVSQASQRFSDPDPVLVEAMEQVLRTEDNEGIRLQTVKALRSIHEQASLTQSLKDMMIGMLTSEKSPAIRIEVLQVLASSEMASIEWRDALQQARQDSNPFIRQQAREALQEMESMTPLEMVR